MHPGEEGARQDCASESEQDGVARAEARGRWDRARSDRDGRQPYTGRVTARNTRSGCVSEARETEQREGRGRPADKGHRGSERNADRYIGEF